jgi:hypothetical protein
MAQTEQKLPEALANVKTRPLFTLRLAVREVQKVGGDPIFRQVGVIPGGTFAGERLSGRVRDGGSDWQTVRPGGSVLLDCRLVLETTDGALIEMTYAGIRAGAPEVLACLAKGEPVDPADYYFRINPLFHTADPKYAWLNDVLAVGIGHRLSEGPFYSVFEIL